MSAATQNEMERLRADRDTAIEQVAYWRERAVAAEGREQALEDAITGEGLEIGEYHSGFCITDASLARLKARWQAEAVSYFAFQHLGGHEQELAEIYASNLRRQAESSECPGHGKCDDPGCPAHYAAGDE